MVSDDRGQLILIGAIAISLILIGLVLVVNTALFTQVVGTEGSVEMTKEAGVAAEEIEDGASAVVHRENVDATSDADESDIEPVVNGDLNRALRNESMNGAGAYVSVTYDLNSAGPATQLYQRGNGTLDDGGSDIRIPDLGTTDIGYARLGIDLSSTADGSEMAVVVEGSAGGTRTLNITKQTGQIELEPPSGPACQVPNADPFLWIDLRTGFDYTERCHFDLFDGLEGPHAIEFKNGGDVHGDYDVVVPGNLLSDSICGIVGDCNEAIWSYELEYTYDTEEVTVGTESGETREVNVYD